MDDKNKHHPKDKKAEENKPEKKHPPLEDIDDLIFADEYIKKHSEK